MEGEMSILHTASHHRCSRNDYEYGEMRFSGCLVPSQRGGSYVVPTLPPPYGAVLSALHMRGNLYEERYEGYFQTGHAGPPGCPRVRVFAEHIRFSPYLQPQRWLPAREVPERLPCQERRGCEDKLCGTRALHEWYPIALEGTAGVHEGWLLYVLPLQLL